MSELIFNKPIPEDWKNALASVQEYFPQAVIAGGCLRDLYLGATVKDVDIFIPVDTVPDEDPLDYLWQKEVHALDSNYICIRTNVYGQVGNQALPGFRCLHAIYRLTNYSIPIELIFIQNDNYDLIHTVSSGFDINICQIEFNGHEVIPSIEFVKGAMDKCIRPVNINRADRQVARLERMQVKYPDFSIDPDYFERNSNVIPFRN